jgi:hypothetical protein
MTTHQKAVASTQTNESRLRTWVSIALGLYVISGIAFAGFGAVGGDWAVVSDATGLILAAALIVVVVLFHRLFSGEHRAVEARNLGVAGMSLAIAGSAILVVGDAGDDPVISMGIGLGLQFVGWGLFGVWFWLISRMASSSGRFGRRWIWAARVACVSLILGMVFTLALGPDSIPAASTLAVTFVSIVAWTLWTRKELVA